MSVTIKDVAREANVSVATVSRALNGHDNVAEEVRQRVLGVADRLRYSPHHAARSLSSRRTQTIGVVLPDLYGEFFSELMRGIDLVARERGLHLLVSSYHGDPAAQGAALRAMRGRVDGLLVMSPFVGERGFLERSLAPALPAVLINSGDADDHPVIRVDSYGGARAMVRHLAEAGHRDIAFIAGPDGNFDARERLRGYRDALAEMLPGAEPRVLPGDFDEASGHRAGRELLAADARPDAVFAANDMMALGCLFAFSQAGVRVPDDIALAGFDDIPLARYVHPSLTTMRVDIAELGGAALRALLQEHQGGRVTALVPELVVRESSRATRG
ncbi:LacI family DNA-binding transcriptional regulator [Luteimonas sp. R10]|uniref:LacI family DNA-binding transcriptional regulator n=1 Tax=Luteimonas sp. R10 TaxID=3108176 RepID=UPI0030896988|nr:LacI family DNA-binding transcriptional regulator [Luteimonas sp. R10]